MTGSVGPAQIVYAAGTVRVNSLSVQLGTVVGPGTSVEQVTGTSPLASVVLDANSGHLAVQGAAVKVTLSGRKVVSGKIKKVETIVAKGDGGQPNTTNYQVTVSFGKSFRSLSGTSAVTVAFTAGKRPNVLAVPVPALVASPAGGYGVQVVDNSTTRFVAVGTGCSPTARWRSPGPGSRRV